MDIVEQIKQELRSIILDQEREGKDYKKGNVGNGDKDSSGDNIVDLGLVSAIIVKGKKVGFTIDIKDYDLKEMEKLRQSAIDRIMALKEVDSVTIALTSNANFIAASESGATANKSHSMPKSNIGLEEKSPDIPKPDYIRHQNLSSISKIIAVASGKGGVGKSTIAANLAISLSKKGKKVGIVDTDIYGPSLHKMFNLTKEPEIDKNNKMIPLEKDGVTIMSMGVLVPNDSALIWRGPMLSKALNQLMVGVSWGKLDYLIIDMPPGTGDVHLTITKNFRPDQAIIVSTPQEISLIDVAKAIDMFKKLNVEITGIIENMSYFIDTKSMNKYYIFGERGVEKFAHKNNIAFLGDIPIDTNISITSDNGSPISASMPNSESAMIFAEISKNL